ncbi:MFS transporter [Amycolatopsis rhabdoformis]|uniref:MFS transporter n=1 Tax=Amycolatopsis rhabdoformis TaxID=1448059 RepID=A0ABZ1IEC1_9PSEU|nr:MFS transporter [Amycolatopsis rhabdoformis]WSE31795.1 MFS transporter [Amycolatopsis rhabdoformis]
MSDETLADTTPPETQPAPSAAATRYARKAVFASSLGYAMDGFDLLILGFALSAISGDLGLGTAQAGSLATITLIGAVVGGIAFGVLADRIGRVKVLTYSVIFFAVFTGLTAISTGYWEIAVFRFLAGVGIGGEFGIGMTLAAEAWPAKKRARATSLVGLGWQAGVLLAALVSAPVLTAWGWRGLFLLGAFPAVVAIVFRSRLHEPEQFTRHRASQVGKPKVPLKLLVADARTTRATIGVLVLTSVQNFGYFGIMIWLPTYLSTQFGYSLTKSGVWTAVTVVGMGVGILAFGEIADKLGRRKAFWLFQAGAAVSVLGYSQLSSPWALMIGGAIMGAFANGMIGGYGALMAELYPTAIRSTAQNVLFNLGRAVGGFAPIVVALVAASYGFGFAIGVLSVIYLLDMVAMIFIPDRRAEQLA